MANADLREFAKTRGVRLWQLANYVGCSEATMTRTLRTELSEQEKARFEAAVLDIAAQEEEAESDV